MQICVRVDRDRFHGAARGFTINGTVGRAPIHVYIRLCCLESGLTSFPYAIDGLASFLWSLAHISNAFAPTTSKGSGISRVAHMFFQHCHEWTYHTAPLGGRRLWGPFLGLSPGWLLLKVPSRIRRRLKHPEWSIQSTGSVLWNGLHG